MKKIQLFRGSEREQEFVQRGDSIVDFLSDPLRPCFVYANTEESPFDPREKQHIAWNYGNINAAHRFRSYIGDLSGCWVDSEIYSLDAIADDKVLVKSTVRNLGFYKHSLKVAGQNGFCELVYNGIADDIVKEFEERGYEIHEFFPERGDNEQIKNWRSLNDRLDEQRINNMRKRAGEINAHYRRK